MSSVLIVEQREQAGSDSYNRFEYQVHWIVCHIIGKLQEDAECIVFCEFHDDMAEFSPNNQQYQFFQIKTKEDSSDWTIAEMSKREKKKSGSYKKSFLGFIFYNYLTFGAECSHCHFVSNNDLDKEVLLWQSYIEDGKRLQTENIALYEKIKDRIKNEFLDDMPSNFDSVFEEFIQNTFVHKSEFSGCSALEEVTAKGQITEIGQQAFYKDTALAKIPDSVTSIADHAFEYTSIEHLILGSGLESIKNDAFSNIGTLETVTIRNSSDAVDISKAGFSGNAVITYTEKSISDSVGSAISDEAGAPTL